MPQLLELPGNLLFTELLGRLADYARPFQSMWPYFWFKAVAMRDPQVAAWRLSYIALVGRWNEKQTAKEFTDAGRSLVATSKLITSDEAWGMLTSLQRYGSVSFAGITAHALPGLIAPGYSWQTTVAPSMYSADIAPLIEDARWRYLYLYGNQPWTLDSMLNEQFRQSFQLDLKQRDEFDFGTYMRTLIGEAYQFTEFIYRFDFPLALQVAYGIPDTTGQIPLKISCHRPLSPTTLHVRPGRIWAASSEELPIHTDQDAQTDEEGWSNGTLTVPADCEKVWFTSDDLHNRLAYPIPIITPENQLAEVIARIHHRNALDEGKQRWRKHLLESAGAPFEIALLNATARFGVPVLFAGDVQHINEESNEETASSRKGSAAAPGYDLIAFNLAERRAVLISAKGSQRNPHPPSPEAYQHLLDEVEAVKALLQGWHVSGLIACQAPDNKLGPHKGRTDIRVWGREDLELLYRASKREAVINLLWGIPKCARS